MSSKKKKEKESVSKHRLKHLLSGYKQTSIHSILFINDTLYMIHNNNKVFKEIKAKTEDQWNEFIQVQHGFTVLKWKKMFEGPWNHQWNIQYKDRLITFIHVIRKYDILQHMHGHSKESISIKLQRRLSDNVYTVKLPLIYQTVDQFKNNMIKQKYTELQGVGISFRLNGINLNKKVNIQ